MSKKVEVSKVIKKMMMFLFYEWLITLATRPDISKEILDNNRNYICIIE